MQDEPKLPAKKRIHVGRFNYTIVETEDRKIEAIIDEIKTAMVNGDQVTISVLDDNDRRLELYLHGGRIDAVAIDSGLGPDKPTEYQKQPKLGT
jgi:hypothetical protein